MLMNSLLFASLAIAAPYYELQPTTTEDAGPISGQTSASYGQTIDAGTPTDTVCEGSHSTETIDAGPGAEPTNPIYGEMTMTSIDAGPGAGPTNPVYEEMPISYPVPNEEAAPSAAYPQPPCTEEAAPAPSDTVAPIDYAGDQAGADTTLELYPSDVPIYSSDKSLGVSVVAGVLVLLAL